MSPRKSIFSKKLPLTAAALLATVFASGCAKLRDPSFGDGQGTDIFEKTSFSASQVALIATGEGEGTAGRRTLRETSEAQSLRISAVEAPERLKGIFRELRIQGKPGTRYPIQFELNRKFVTAFKISDTVEDFSPEEQQLSTRRADGKHQTPLFQLPVRGYGVVTRVKNDLGEETSNLRLQPTEWEEATHIQISPLASDRNEVHAPSEETEQVFVRDRIQGAVFTREEFSRTFNVSLSLPDSALVQTQLNGSELLISEVTALSAIPEALRSRVAPAGTRGAELSHCSDAVLSELRAHASPSSSNASAPNCVVVQRFRLNAPSVRARRATDADGFATPSVSFQSTPSSTSSSLVRVERHARPNPILINGDTVSHLSDEMVKLSDLRNQEFLLRRTLQDSPNAFDFAFAGTSGPLEIVRFQPTRDRLEVVRSRALIPGQGSNAVDRETLLSFSARYFREERTDSDGSPLTVPRFVPTDSSDPHAVAMVDWASNSMANVSSPLSYYELESCFDGARSKQVTDVDRRLQVGALNFTVLSTYAGSRSQDCAGIYSAGYFDAVQSHFTFAERISFQRYQAPANEETPLFSIPYDAQKKLGFGLFTHTKSVPNRYGSTGVDGTEIPLASIFDLREGKGIEYVLAGLPDTSSPENRATREAVIRATREVIADWNAAFRKALEGTPLARGADVITLKIEGVDSEPRKLGDLERNYLYYIQKRTESGVIGLGGAHANPRNGRVEAASVFMYGGNIRASVEGMRKIDQAVKAYRAAMTPQAEPINAPSGAPVAMLRPSRARGAIASAATARTLHESDARRHQNLAVASADALNHAALVGNLSAESTVIQAAIQKTLAEGSLRDPRTISRAILEAQARGLRGSLGRDALARVRAEARRLESIQQLQDRLRSDNICVREASDGINAVPSDDLNQLTDLQIETRIYKSTLAHEIGHNLGLRHNFIASYDKKNWKFDASDSSARNYSSVMDYQGDDHLTYDGLGPQDVSAIRAAYAQEVELDSDLINRLPTVSGRKVIPIRSGRPIPLNQERFLSIENYRRLLGVGSWLEFTSNDVAALPLKNYLFCSDEDVGFTPVCNRFDRGTTPAEIVRAIIDDYRTTYAIRNFPGDRIRFGYGQTSSYIGRLVQRFIGIRQFLDETFYQAVSGADEETINSNLEAAIEGLMFFHQVVRTPDAPSYLGADERFAQVEAANGEKIVVERKYPRSLVNDLVADRLAVRGIEYDKMVALILLTERSLGMPRYEQASLRVSYPQMEKLVGLTVDRNRPDGLMTLSLLREILGNNLTPAAFNAQGQLVRLGEGFKSSITELMRIRAILGSTLSLDLDGLEVSDNFAALYRVHSGYRLPVQALGVRQSGADSASELTYWAFGDSKSAQSLIKQTQALDAVLSRKTALVTNLRDWFNKNQTASASHDDQERTRLQQEIQTLETEVNIALQELPEEVGPRSISELGPVMTAISRQFVALEQAAPSMPRAQVRAVLRESSEQLESWVKEAPSIILALEAIPAEALNLQLYPQIVPTGTLSSERGILFRNIQTLNQLFRELHPEYRSP